MHKQLKRYISFFFLFLFLFPQAEKQIHAFAHASELHCSSSDKHFHEPEHSCPICDFTSTDSSPLAENAVSFILSETEVCYHPFTGSVHEPSGYAYLPARAPPVV
jgi:hypothetical protein